MDGNFNTQILVDKLAKLNSSQQSIETLSHWCIFHRKNAKQVVETWQREFHCSAHSQRISFLFLANDILQNSRWKGAEFVSEFWKVLPDALNSVVAKGDEFGRSTALRLVEIWDDRKVFGSRGKTLKDELAGRRQEKYGKNGASISNKTKQPMANVLEKLIRCYEHVHDVSIDEDTVLSKCDSVITFLENMEKEINNQHGKKTTPMAMEELHQKPLVLKEYIRQLESIETARLTLVSQLREALQEQESKLETVRNKLQAVETQSKVSDGISVEQTNKNNQPLPLLQAKETILYREESSNFDQGCQADSVIKERPTHVIYNQQGTVGTTQQLVVDAPNGKQVNLEDDMPYTPPHPPEYLPEPLPPLPDQDSPPQMLLSHPGPSYQSPPPSSASHPVNTVQGGPPQPPMLPFVQPATNTPFMQVPPPPYGYIQQPSPQWTPSLPGYPMVNMLPYPSPPMNLYQNMQVLESSGFPNQTCLPATMQPTFQP